MIKESYIVAVQQNTDLAMTSEASHYQFMVYAPDKTDDGCIERRLSMRPKVGNLNGPLDRTNSSFNGIASGCCWTTYKKGDSK